MASLFLKTIVATVISDTPPQINHNFDELSRDFKLTASEFS